MKIDIIGVPFDNLNRKQVLERLLQFLDTDKNHLLITPNPEIVMEAQNDDELMAILQQADLVIPDGIGIVFASRIMKSGIRERVEGCDTILSLFNVIKGTDKTVYLLGAKPGIAEKATLNMEQKYKNLKIIGVHDGYFDENQEESIIREIQDLKPDLLLVGLGCPRQEKWINRNKDILPVKVSAAIGGSIDIMAGEVKRAPKILRLVGFEWFYRLIDQPKRIFRMTKLPLFLIECFKNRNKTNIVK